MGSNLYVLQPVALGCSRDHTSSCNSSVINVLKCIIYKTVKFVRFVIGHQIVGWNGFKKTFDPFLKV